MRSLQLAHCNYWYASQLGTSYEELHTGPRNSGLRVDESLRHGQASMRCDGQG
jgi:hypothetical protein